jgi:hypothetical protein
LANELNEYFRAAVARLPGSDQATNYSTDPGLHCRGLNGLILIVTSIFIGTHILTFFGISLPVVQVAGGLIVISTGWGCFAQQTTMGMNRMVARDAPSRTTRVRHFIL